ncbi:MAG: IS21 family transposase [Candidatus Eremiobacteraeota bacterium]|nr:IS21 family transposase [Candidatus Eremiobacteraeota bacterium]
MFTKELQVEIHVLARQGKGIRAIARMVGCSRNSVRRVLRGDARGRYGPRPRRPKKLDAYTNYVRDRIQDAKPDRLSAAVLLREIHERGYGGGYSQLKALVRSLSPTPQPQPVLRFETEPGKQCQIDLVIFRRRPPKLAAFTAYLGYSRYGYAEFTDNERVETLIACLENAFEFFGGAPQALLCDNAKTIVRERDAYGEGKHRLNQAFLDFTGHYGVRTHLCHPYRAQTKGKVERFHRYVRESFYVPLATRVRPDFIDVAMANREVRPWLNRVANVRIHGTTKEQPIARWQRERALLLPLPPRYSGRRPGVDAVVGGPLVPMPYESLQHPLARYQELVLEVTR